jgi:glutaminyl-peptide cyclotransferase
MAKQRSKRETVHRAMLKIVCVAAILSVTVLARSAPARSARAARPQVQSKPALNLPPFDSTRAFDDLKHMVAFGPRTAGSPALARTREWIEGQLAMAGIKVDEDKFTASTPLGDIDMANLIVRVPGASPNIVIVCGHYDTKRFDRFKFVGANDGGSSAAMVMELARAMAKRPMPYTLWFLWTDGEEAEREQWEGNDNDYGSRHLEQKLASEGELNRVKAFLLVDMIGDAKLDIRKDPGSTPWLTELEFSTAQRLGYGRYFLDQQYPVGGDDYDPWLAAGVPSVDIIDFDYGPNAKSKPGDRDFNIYWHTAQDTVDHCSPQSLEIVGRVVLGMLQELGNSPHLR